MASDATIQHPKSKFSYGHASKPLSIMPTGKLIFDDHRLIYFLFTVIAAE